MLSLLKDSEDALTNIQHQITELEQYEAEIHFSLQMLDKEPKSIKCIGDIGKKILMILIPMWVISTIAVCSRVQMKNMLNIKEFKKDLANSDMPKLWHPYALPEGEKQQPTLYDQLLNTAKITTKPYKNPI